MILHCGTFSDGCGFGCFIHTAAWMCRGFPAVSHIRCSFKRWLTQACVCDFSSWHSEAASVFVMDKIIVDGGVLVSL